MWIEFFRAFCVTALVLYVPGYLFFRGLRFSRVLSFCCAPIWGVFVYACLPIIYYDLGIRCSPLTVGMPALAIGLALFIYVKTHPRKDLLCLSKKEPIELFGKRVPFDVIVPLLFVVLASAVCIFVFLRSLPHPGAFAPRNDNQTHLNLARAFVESGKWSTMHVSAFLNSAPNAASRSVTGGFYPGAWACIVVLTCMLSGSELMIAINAVITMSASVIFPLGMYAFLRVLLPMKRRAIVLGAIAVTGFSNCPWLYIHTGPLYPNQLGISLQFSAMAVLIAFLELPSRKSCTAPFFLSCVISFIALALAHPTTIFSAYVFMACYGAHILVNKYSSRRRVIALVAFAIGIVAFWVFCYQLPMLAGVIGYVELEQTDLSEVIVDLLGMRFTFTNAQISIVVFSIFGFLYLIRHKKRRWMLLPVLFFAVGYIATRIDWWPAKHWISGLWYSDRRRMSMNLSLYLMPIVALGLDSILPHRIERNVPRGRALPWGRTSVFALLAVLIYLPAISIPALGVQIRLPYGIVAQHLEDRYRETIYSQEEVQFVDEVIRAIPEGSLVLNFPADGSMWAYGVNNLNAYYRYITTGDLTDDANTIRKHLREYSYNKGVQEAVARTGASYVLLLDMGAKHADREWLWQFAEEDMELWVGINSINDTTPGFTRVMSKGDMRLYRIDTL